MADNAKERAVCSLKLMEKAIKKVSEPLTIAIQGDYCTATSCISSNHANNRECRIYRSVM